MNPMKVLKIETRGARRSCRWTSSLRTESPQAGPGTIRTEGGPKGNGAFNASNRMLAYGDEAGGGLGVGPREIRTVPRLAPGPKGRRH
jgi:hypothetical protein